MNRRVALLTTLLSGGWLARRALARAPFQVQPPESAPDGLPGDGVQFKKPIADSEPDPNANNAADPNQDPDQAGSIALKPEADHVYKEIPIKRYTDLDHKKTRPEEEIIKWIFRRTGQSAWYGSKRCSLSATPEVVQVYHRPKMVEEVSKVVDRFMNPDHEADFIQIQAKALVTSDLGWRYSNLTQLQAPLLTTKTGQQIWMTSLPNAASLMALEKTSRGRVRLLAEQKYEIINGQAFDFGYRLKNGRPYVSGLQTTGPAGASAPQLSRKVLEEGFLLTGSPLLDFDDESIEIALNVKASGVKSTIRTRIIAPQQANQQEFEIQVPEVVESHLETVIEKLPLNQVLLISMGILPGRFCEDRARFGDAFRFSEVSELLILLHAEALTTRKLVQRNRNNTRARQ